VPRWLYGFLIFGVAALIADLAGASELLVFGLAALGIIPVSGLIGRSTEDLARHIGPKFGGLLNATFGNAAELIIGIVALRAGLLDLVKASVTGSIIGNVLLVLGMGFFIGGVRHGTLHFDAREASRNSVMMLLALAGLLLPAFFRTVDEKQADVEHMSVAVAIVLIAMYFAYIGFSFTKEGEIQLHHEMHPEEALPSDGWSMTMALGVLVAATAATVVLAEILVGTVEHVTEQFSLSELFVGIIIVPIIGNVAEHFSAVQLAAKNQPNVAQAIAAGSSTQVALLVAPLFILLSHLLGHPMDLVFSPLEIAAVGFAGFLFAFISSDGESNWLEAAQMLGLYIMTALVFFFLPH
jgi:Ca2+:H+ antiporter